MSNYSDYNTPVPCPFCGSDCHAEFVDVGVGMVQCSPYHCENCGAYEIGTYDGYGPEKRSIEEEKHRLVCATKGNHLMSKVYLLMQVKRLNQDNTIDSFVRAAYKTPESAICAMECIILRNASLGIRDTFFISETEVND